MTKQHTAMRKRLTMLMRKAPASMIVFTDTGKRIEVATLGAEVDLRVLHAEGTKTLAGMLEQARSAEFQRGDAAKET